MNHISHLIPMQQQSYPAPANSGFGTIQTAPQAAPQPAPVPAAPQAPWQQDETLRPMNPAPMHMQPPTPQVEEHVCDHSSCNAEVDRLKKALSDIQAVLSQALSAQATPGVSAVEAQLNEMPTPTTSDNEVEGVFDGERMISQDGQTYDVPPNYASKSKLVEGDLMKLSISPRGAHRYKQIGPTKRMRLKGSLMQDPNTGSWQVMASGKLYRILTASVTFHKGRPGDEVTILVPESGVSSWGAVEHIIHA